MNPRFTVTNENSLLGGLTMPRNQFGHVMALPYVPKGQLAAYEREWGVWARANSPKDYPRWLHDWIAARKREAAK